MVSRFDSPVSVQIEGDGLGYLPQALQLMDETMKRRTIGNLPMLKRVMPLGDGAYAYAITAGGVNVVRIVAPPEDEPQVDEPSLATLYPDFYSGVVYNGIETEKPTDPDTKVLSQFDPTADCARLFKLKDSPQQVVKLDVLLYTAFDELGAPEDSPLKYTQYQKLKPTMYSGAMRKCVQLLMGFGRQADKSIYDAKITSAPDPDDDSTPATPPPSTYDTEVTENGLQIRYDYRFAKTQGLVQTVAGDYWLVEISMARGIIAMPLPLHASTTTDAFRQIVTDLNDPAGMEALDTFGGFPTGETFPEFPEMFDAWARAGRILHLAPVSEVAAFYHNDFYSSAMGWCFNPSGSEAHNTAYNFDNPDGVQRGVHYACTMSVTTSPPITPDPRANGLKAAFGEKSDNAAIFYANMFKIDRLDSTQVDDVLGRIQSDGIDGAYDFLNNLQVTPMGTGNAACRQMGEGKIFWPTKLGQPQIKYPEPILGYLVSHDMRPELAEFGNVIFCDTVMHVMYQGAQLKVCKLYIDPRTLASRVTGDDQYDIDYNPVGNFTQNFDTGPLGVPAMFYTTDYDDRADTGTATDYNRYFRKDHGWCVIGGFQGFMAPIGFTNNAGPLTPDFDEGGASENHKLVIWKSKYFSYEHWQSVRTGVRLSAAVAVPFFDRNAYYYARLTGHQGGFDSYTYNTGWMASPYIGHWFRETGEILLPETQRKTDDGNPWPTFWGVADEGDWVPHGVPAGSIAYGTVPSHSSFSNTNVPANLKLEVFLVGNEALGTVPTWTETRAGDDAEFWEPFWFTPSPDPDTDITAYIQENANSFGPSECTIADTDMNESHLSVAPGRQIFGFPRDAQLLSGADTFVGVV